jgi:hypothetical protein
MTKDGRRRVQSRKIGLKSEERRVKSESGRADTERRFFGGPQNDRGAKGSG